MQTVEQMTTDRNTTTTREITADIITVIKDTTIKDIITSTIITDTIGMDTKGDRATQPMAIDNMKAMQEHTSQHIATTQPMEAITEAQSIKRATRDTIVTTETKTTNTVQILEIIIDRI